MAAIIADNVRKLFRRKNVPPLVCSVDLGPDGHPIGDDPNHKHTAACFISFDPLAVVDPNLLLLTYNVIIFDHLGWKDTYASAAWDQRQRTYAKKWKCSNLFTPQVVVNGVADGSSAGGMVDVPNVVRQARSMQEIRIESDRAEAEPYDILVVLYQGAEEIIKIGKGPNKGKKLKHRNVVTNVMKIGEWAGGNMTMPLPAPKSVMQPGEDAAVLI
ncbi:hypothetical protein CC78DRAFT_554334 [Lojkania enalia]|uniref:Uncharacterized protein n=1 Tax=Lojkania enalia TaxID=147567 RepID=A0A9P4N204_9PLEO|nr:hypothetical protein CC78DRAFT_554334 [Didymosphaeria enalia]